jgi:hypothetical protein
MSSGGGGQTGRFLRLGFAGSRLGAGAVEELVPSVTAVSGTGSLAVAVGGGDSLPLHSWAGASHFESVGATSAHLPDNAPAASSAEAAIRDTRRFMENDTGQAEARPLSRRYLHALCHGHTD